MLEATSMEALKRGARRDSPLSSLPQIGVEALSGQLQESSLQVLDVRREPEWEAGHIEGATWWPLDNFKVAPPEIDRNLPVAVHCKGGYRSMIACSLLQRAGFNNVFNLVGGFEAWQQANLPVAKSPWLKKKRSQSKRKSAAIRSPSNSG